MAELQDYERCQYCGEAIEDNGIEFDIMMCADCQRKTFESLESANGAHFALFLMCGMTNVPCIPSVVPEDFANMGTLKWHEYLKALQEQGKHVKKSGKLKGFFDGERNIRKIFGRELSQTDFAKFIENEQNRTSKLPGTEEQRERWGTQNIHTRIEMTQEVYDELDRQYEARCAEFKGQTLSLQQKDTLIKVCKWNYIVDYQTAKGDVDMAKKYHDLVQKELESEQMRKKDEKPVSGFMFDAGIDRLEKNGFMENGDFKNFDEIKKEINKNHFHSKKANGSLDIIDQMIYAIHNTMRKNRDLPTEDILPDTLKVEDENGEMQAQPSKTEIENMRYAKLTPVQFDTPRGAES